MTLSLHTLVHPIRVDAHGVARIADTRVTLESLMSRFQSGDTPEEIADAYGLDLADVYATVSYYLQHRAEVDAYLRAAQEQEDRAVSLIDSRSAPGALRQRLLSRQAAKTRAS